MASYAARIRPVSELSSLAITSDAKLIRGSSWLSVQIRRISMVRTRQSSQLVFRSILTRHGDLKARNDTGVFYIGLGDQFDDDRRLVREAMSEFRPAIRSTRAGASLPVISAASRPPLGSSKATLLQSALAVCARFGWPLRRAFPFNSRRTDTVPRRRR